MVGGGGLNFSSLFIDLLKSRVGGINLLNIQINLIFRYELQKIWELSYLFIPNFTFKGD